MSEEAKTADSTFRVQLIEDLRRIAFDGMKKAEQAHNWELFSRYADVYCRLVG